MSRRLTRFVLLCFGLALVASACSRTTVITEGSRASDPSTSDVSTDGADSGVDDEPAISASDAAADPSTEADDADGTDDPLTDDAAASGDGEDAASDTPSDPADVLGVGGSEQIAGLTADCTSGSEMACDILFQASGLDSPEEQVARTCGGRRPDNVGFCTDAILPDGANLWFDEDSPGLPAVVGACEVGFMTACDFLYFRSAVGSPYEEIGNTCAGRIEIAIPDCRTAFPEE